MSFKHSSKKQLKSKKKTEIQKIQNNKPTIFLFIDPFVCHRIYRDFLIPDHAYSTNSPIHHFQEYLNYKTVTQVHLRENGLVLQLTDIMPEYVTPLKVLVTRLNSMGNNFAHELAEFLPVYYSYFQSINNLCSHECSIINEEDFKDSCSTSLKVLHEKRISSFKLMNSFYEPILPIESTTSVLLKIMDDLFLSYKEDIVLATVYQLYQGLDDRLIMLGYNKELMNWLTFEDGDLIGKVFENEFLDQLLQMFTYFSFDRCVKDMTEFLKFFPLKRDFDPMIDVYSREINTVFGPIKGDFRLKNINFEINGNKFNLICSILQKQEQNSFIRDMMQKKKEMHNIKEINKKTMKSSSDWEKILKFYYPHILEI